MAAAAARAPLYRVDLIAPATTGSGEARAVNAAGDVAGQENGAAFVLHAGRFTSHPPVHYLYVDRT